MPDADGWLRPWWLRQEASGGRPLRHQGPMLWSLRLARGVKRLRSARNASASEPPVSATSDGYRPVLCADQNHHDICPENDRYFARQGVTEGRRLATVLAAATWHT